MNDTSIRMHNKKNSFALPFIPVSVSVSCCLALSSLYVASLYVWSKKYDRDHPSMVKRRFCSVFVVMLIAPIFVYKFSAPELLERVPFIQLLGLRWDGLLAALVIPILLTMLLFLGPLCMLIQNGQMRLLLDCEFITDCFKNLLWLRNHIVAPLTEEFVYRACMMPLILQSFTPMIAVLITPLFFGTAHIHHIAEHLSLGVELKKAIAISCFQFAYTTLFGFYSAYLFARTGHIVAPLLVHSFCNYIGLPNINDLWQQHWIRRTLYSFCYIVGFVGWLLLLPIATEPTLYANTIFWNV